jgi:hypothetical protein
MGCRSPDAPADRGKEVRAFRIGMGIGQGTRGEQLEIHAA